MTAIASTAAGKSVEVAYASNPVTAAPCQRQVPEHTTLHYFNWFVFVWLHPVANLTAERAVRTLSNFIANFCNRALCCSPPPPGPPPPPPPPCTPYGGVCTAVKAGRKLSMLVSFSSPVPCCAGMGCAVQSNSSTICAYPPGAPTVISVTTTGRVFNVTASPPNNTGGPDIGEVHCEWWCSWRASISMFAVCTRR